MDYQSGLQQHAAASTEEEWAQLLQLLQEDVPIPALSGYVEPARQSFDEQNSQFALPFDDEMPQELFDTQASMLGSGGFPAFAPRQFMEQDPRPALPIDNTLPQETFDLEASNPFFGEVPAFVSMQPVVDGTELDQLQNSALMDPSLDHFDNCQSDAFNHLQGYPMIQEGTNEQSTNLFQSLPPSTDFSYQDASFFLPQQSLSWDETFHYNSMDLDRSKIPDWNAPSPNQFNHWRLSTSDHSQGHHAAQQGVDEPNTVLTPYLEEDLRHGHGSIALPQLPLVWENNLLVNDMLSLAPQCFYSYDTNPAPIATLQGPADANHTAFSVFQQRSCQTQTSAPRMINRPVTAVNLLQPLQPAETRITNPAEGRMVTTNTSNRSLKEPSSDDWFMLRPILYSLYSEHTLAEVRDILKTEYGFKTSEKILRDHYKKWDQRKRLRSEEMAAVFRRLSIRDSLNKNSEVRVRGKRIPMVEVRRYRKRNPPSLRPELSRLRSLTPLGVRVEVFTPPPSSVSAPDHLRLPEEIIHRTKDLIMRLFKEKVWVSVGDTQSIKYSRRGGMSEDPFFPVDTALKLFEAGRLQEAERMFTIVHTKFRKNLSLEDGMTRMSAETLGLFDGICRYARLGMINFILPTIDFFSATLSSVLGPKHPTALLHGRINLYLLSAEANALSQGYQTIMASLVDFFAQALGSLHMSTIQLRLDYIYEVILYNDYERGLSGLRDLARSCDEDYRGAEDLRSPYTDLRLLSVLNDWEYDLHQEKLDLADKILGRTKQCGFPSWSIGFFLRKVHSQLSKVWEDQRQFDTAEFHLKEAIRLSTADNGPRDSMTPNYQRKFEDLLRRRGKIEEADDVRRQIRAELGLVSENV